jgi:regulator of protease activity HflC (stomatin/prohibitin superfamily)
MAVLFALGKIKYRLKPGWYVVLIPFQELEKESMAWQALHVKEDGKPNEEAEMSDLYYIEDSSRGDGGSTGGTKEGERSPKRSRPIKIRVGMRVFYRLKNPVGAIRTYGELSSQAFCNDLDSTSKSALRSVLGKNSFDKLLTEKETLEQEIAKSVNKELNHIADQLFNENMKLKDAPSGYVTGSIDLHYMKEEVRSKASETTELADADSYRVRRMVSATAEPLKGNPEAARVNVAEIVSNAARDIASGLTNALVGGGRGEKKASSKGEKSDEVRVSKEQLKKFVENL